MKQICSTTDHGPRTTARTVWLSSVVCGLGCALLLVPPGALGAQEPDLSARPDLAGEVFSKPVPMSVFSYHHKTAVIFTRSGAPAPNQEQSEQEAWQNLIFLRQADAEGITVGKTQLQNELRRLVDARGIEYGGAAYERWVRANVGEDAKSFERRIEELLKINQYVQRHTDPQVTVTEEEITQKFLNQRNSLEMEYVGFETPAEADAFLEHVRAQPALWKPTFEHKRNELGQKGAAWINIMTLEALIDLWQFPKDEIYRILGEPQGIFTRGRHLYGELVVRTLLKQEADLKEFTDAQRDRLRNDITQTKKHQAVKRFFDDLMKQAALRSYIQERREAQERSRIQALVPILKEKSQVILETSQGTVELRLFPEAAPKACENFIGLVEKGYYNSLTFHRVKKEFMIQGGDPTGTGSGGESLWGKPFEDEVKEDVTFDRPGLLAMANSGPNTNASQFFITTVPTGWLNGKHTIFGEVVSGLDVVQRIESVPTDAADKPLEPQNILSAQIKQ